MNLCFVRSSTGYSSLWRLVNAKRDFVVALSASALQLAVGNRGALGSGDETQSIARIMMATDVNPHESGGLKGLQRALRHGHRARSPALSRDDEGTPQSRAALLSHVQSGVILAYGSEANEVPELPEQDDAP
jgi:hypothetical protein